MNISLGYGIMPQNCLIKQFLEFIIYQAKYLNIIIVTYCDLQQNVLCTTTSLKNCFKLFAKTLASQSIFLKKSLIIFLHKHITQFTLFEAWKILDLDNFLGVKFSCDRKQS